MSRTLDVCRRATAAPADQIGDDEGDAGAEKADVLKYIAGASALTSPWGEVLSRIKIADRAKGSVVVVLVASTVQDFIVESFAIISRVIRGAARNALQGHCKGL